MIDEDGFEDISLDDSKKIPKTKTNTYEEKIFKPQSEEFNSVKISNEQNKNSNVINDFENEVLNEVVKYKQLNLDKDLIKNVETAFIKFQENLSSTQENINAKNIENIKSNFNKAVNEIDTEIDNNKKAKQFLNILEKTNQEINPLTLLSVDEAKQLQNPLPTLNTLDKIKAALKAAGKYALEEVVVNPLIRADETAYNQSNKNYGLRKKIENYFLSPEQRINENLTKLETLVSEQLKANGIQEGFVVKNKAYRDLSPKDKVDKLIKTSQNTHFDSFAKNKIDKDDEAKKARWYVDYPNISKLGKSIIIEATNNTQPGKLTQKVNSQERDLNQQLSVLANNAGISKDSEYLAAVTPEYKIILIEEKLKEKKDNLSFQPMDKNEHMMSSKNTNFEDETKSVDHTINDKEKKNNIDLVLKRLETTKHTLSDLRKTEQQLSNPKAPIVVRAATSIISGAATATLATAKALGIGAKTALKALINAPTKNGIKKTYQKNKNKGQGI